MSEFINLKKVFILLLIILLLLFLAPEKTEGSKLVESFIFRSNRTVYLIAKEIERYQPQMDDYNRYFISLLINYHSQLNNIDPYFIAAICATESSFRHREKGKILLSNKNAVGIMQLTHFVETIYDVNRYDLEDNIKGGVMFISDLLKQYDNNKKYALAHYNAGNNPALKLKNEDVSNYVNKVINNFKKLKHGHLSSNEYDREKNKDGDSLVWNRILFKTGF